MLRRLPAVMPVFVPLMLAACATPGPILNTSVGTIRTGLGQADEQTALVFNATNATAREIDVARALASPLQNLRESDFPRALSPEDIEQWANAFDALDRYLAAAQRLVDPRRAAQTADELDGIAQQLREGPVGLKLPAAATGAFSTLAGALVQAKAERTATAVLRRVDPAFAEVMGGMADAIGTDDRSGLRQTIRSYWEKKLADIRAEYSAIPAAAVERRRPVALKFVKAIDDRDAQLADLRQLRSTLLALGEAHAAAARGDQGDALFWIGRIGGWLDEAKRRIDAARKDGA